MDHFDYQAGALCAEDVPLAAIAEAVGTPCYVYSTATLVRHARVFADALAILPRRHIAFAVKSNPNLAVLKLLARQGYGADVVSAGEMERALAAGMAPEAIVFSGVGKTSAELARAVEAEIGQFNLESEEEGVELAAIAAALGKRARAALRERQRTRWAIRCSMRCGLCAAIWRARRDCRPMSSSTMPRCAKWPPRALPIWTKWAAFPASVRANWRPMARPS